MGQALAGGGKREAAPDVAAPNILSKALLDDQVARGLSGAGSGDPTPAARAAETARFQALLNSGRSFSIPEPANSYAVDTLHLSNGQSVTGAGQYDESNRFQFVGNGRGPVFRMGDGSGRIRRGTLRDLSVANSGAPCIVLDHAPNALIERVRAETRLRGSTIVGRRSFRCAIRDSSVQCSGGGTAIDLMDNMNGLTLENITCSGGRAGRAIRIGQSQGVRLVSNIIESSRDGIWIASTDDPADGNCNGVLVSANYLEQCATPLVLGRHYSVIGLECASNFISNSGTSIVADRTAAVQIGRIRGGQISGNAILTDSSEDAFWIWLYHPSGGIEGLSVTNNQLGGEPHSALYRFKGQYADNQSMKALVGSACNFSFMGGVAPLGSDDVREWLSPLIDSSESIPPTVWLPASQIAMGGKILSAEILDHSGGSLDHVALAVGRTGAASETLGIADLAELSFSHGRAELPLGPANIYSGQDCLYSTRSPPGANGRFRLRLRYRAN